MLIITLNVSPGGLKEGTGLDLDTNMEKFEAFDLKITKLTGNSWDRTDMKNLLVQLINGQGNPRHSIENRIIIAFDKSPSSSIEFFKSNKDLIINALVTIAKSPYKYTYWLESHRCWGSIYLFQEGEYQYISEYHEHPIGLGLREPEKAEIANRIIREASVKSDFKIRPNRNYKEIGKDAELKFDVSKLIRISKSEEKQLSFFKEINARHS